MNVTNITNDYDNISSISNCTNNENDDMNIIFKYLLFSIPSIILLFSLIKPLINNK